MPANTLFIYVDKITFVTLSNLYLYFTRNVISRSFISSNNVRNLLRYLDGRTKGLRYFIPKGEHTREVKLPYVINRKCGCR